MKRSRVMRWSSGGNLIISRETDSSRDPSLLPPGPRYFISCQCEIYDSIGQNLLFCQPPAKSSTSETKRFLKGPGRSKCTKIKSKMITAATSGMSAAHILKGFVDDEYQSTLRFLRSILVAVCGFSGAQKKYFTSVPLRWLAAAWPHPSETATLAQESVRFLSRNALKTSR